MWEKFQKLFSTIKNNRALAFTVLGLLLISTFVNFRILDHDKAVVLIEGEKPSDMNFIPMLAKNPLFDQGKSLELSADKLPDNHNYFSLTYKFKVLRTGVYFVLIAGTPPGASKPGSEWDWFSPYWISFDGAPPIHITKETIDRMFWGQLNDVEYIPGGYHWTRLGSFPLKKGEHQIEIRIDEKRYRDGSYVFYLDSIFLAPEGWKPLRLFKKFPKDFFTEPTNLQ